MRNLWSLYGKNFLAVVGLTGAILIVGGLLRYEWFHYGVASDRAKAEWEESIFADEVPILDVRCRRFGQGETVYLKELASAYEGGNDISSQIRFQNEEGDVLTGKLDTGKPGRYVLIVSVKSDYSGKKVMKKICILVDGRVKS